MASQRITQSLPLHGIKKKLRQIRYLIMDEYTYDDFHCETMELVYLEGGAREGCKVLTVFSCPHVAVRSCLGEELVFGLDPLREERTAGRTTGDSCNICSALARLYSPSRLIRLLPTSSCTTSAHVSPSQVHDSMELVLIETATMIRAMSGVFSHAVMPQVDLVDHHERSIITDKSTYESYLEDMDEEGCLLCRCIKNHETTLYAFREFIAETQYDKMLVFYTYLIGVVKSLALIPEISEEIRLSIQFIAGVTPEVCMPRQVPVTSD